MAFDNVDGEVELVEGFSTELKVAELDIARPDADVELLWVEVLDVHAQEPVQQVRDETFQHGGGCVPLGRYLAQEQDERKVLNVIIVERSSGHEIAKQAIKPCMEGYSKESTVGCER